MTPEQIAAYKDLIVAVGGLIILITTLVGTIGGILRGQKAAADIKAQNVVLGAVSQQVNGQMEHVLETKAIVADKLAVATDKLASITQSPADIQAAVIGVMIADDAKKALDDHKSGPGPVAIPLLAAALCLTLWGCGERHEAAPQDVSRVSEAVEHHCYIDKNGNQICK